LSQAATRDKYGAANAIGIHKLVELGVSLEKFAL